MQRFVVTSSTPKSATVTLTGVDASLQSISETLSVSPHGKVETGKRYLAMTAIVAPDGISVGRSADKPDMATGDGQTLVVRDGLQRAVHAALEGLPVIGRLVNLTGGATTDTDPVTANPQVPIAIDAIGNLLFEGEVPDAVRSEATDALLELASYAKAEPDGQPLLAARVHALFRGLPGLWGCADENCATLPAGIALGPTGMLYAQATRECSCRARVFEVHTCRDCGVAYFNAFALNPSQPEYLWAEDVGDIDDVDGVVRPVQILLEDPGLDADKFCITAFLDPLTAASGRSLRMRARSGCHVQPRMWSRAISRNALTAKAAARRSWTTRPRATSRSRS